MTTICQLLLLGATALALSTQPSRAGTCAQDIDRAWVQVNAKIQARIAAGRSRLRACRASPLSANAELDRGS